MGKQFGSEKGQSKPGPEEDALKYIPALKDMLDLESANTITIKNGISSVSNLISDYARNKRDAVKAHQVRNLFELVKEKTKDGSTEEKTRQLNFIRPKLAYIGARQTSYHGKVVTEVINQLIIYITDEKEESKREKYILGLDYVMESIVAYHKFYLND